MKRFLMLMVAFFSLFSISARESSSDSDEVTVEGTVYIWTLDNAQNATATMGDFGDITGGEYLRAPNLYVEVEFGWLNRDLVTYTDNYGRYRVTKGNPWWGSYSVDVEVRAEVLLDVSNQDDINLVSMYPAGTDFWLFYEGRLNWYPYNGQTGKASVGDGETVTMDVYIGGPGKTGGYSITDWWDDYPSDHLIGFYSVEVIRDAYHWAVNHGIPAEDISREISMLYPAGDSLQYSPFTPPPGVGHIDINSKDLYPDEVADPQSIGEYWQTLRGDLTHEYGHKIMHDVYTVLPMGFEDPKCTGHGISSTITGECGLVEGWAEFFAAAVLGRPTANGSLAGSNLEYTYHPNPVRIEDAGQGTFTWREQVTDGLQHENEGENAAVLWDIYDPKSWEYMLPAQQESAQTMTPPWPVPLRWYDRLSDPQLADIWTILREDDPDRMWDETTTYEITNDGFWKYWRDRFSSDSAKIHGLKAILYNREIYTYPLWENEPEVHIVSVDLVNRKARLTITELDEEDRPYLYYNLAYRQDDTSALRLVHNTDTLVANLGGTWQGDTLTVEVALPPAEWIHEMVFMVHDSMLPYFAPYLVIGGDTGQDGGAGQDLQELTLTDGGLLPGLPAGGRMIEKDGLLYVAAESKGLRIYDLRTHPEAPVELGAFNLPDFLPWPIDLEGDYVYIADTDEVYKVDVSQPSNPRMVASLSFDPPADVKTLGLDYYGGLLYYTAGYEGLYILQSQTNGQLAVLGRYENDDCTVASDVVVTVDTIYLVCEYTGLQILDISSNPISPVLVGTWQIDTPLTENGGHRLYEDIVLDPVNKRLYLAITWDGVYVLDISKPQQPAVQAVIKPTGVVMGLSVSDNILYTIEGWPQGMTAIDISNINEPVELAYLDMVSAGVNILVVGDYAYLGHSNGVLTLVEIEKP
ncbi:MAG: hypothetical protein MUO30_01825 [Anaerolineales bacterium]|nr:hypothetical protein [Anaerolineales bacterium]